MKEITLILFCLFILRTGSDAKRSRNNPLDSFMDKFMSVVLPQNEKNGTFRTYDWKKYKRYDTDPDFPLEDLPGYCYMLPQSEVPTSNELRYIGKTIAEIVYSQIGYNKRLKNHDIYTAFFNDYIPPPKYLIEHWRDDEEFSRQFIQGIHPLMIQVCRVIEQIPLDMQSLTYQDKNVSQLIQLKRLFIVDYELLDGIPFHKPFKFYAPTVLLYKQLPQGNSPEKSKLMVLGIQLTRKKSSDFVDQNQYSSEFMDDFTESPSKAALNVVYTPKSPPNRYLFAKIHVNSADAQIHHLINHLGFCHLVIEAIAVSFHNHLKKCEHRLSNFLEPHFHKTIYQGFVARSTVLAPVNPSSDKILSIGTVSSFRIFHRILHNYTFLELNFINQIHNRGFKEDRGDGLEGYYYRDDGFKVWNALSKYVETFIFRVYSSDADVTHDKDLQAFAATIANPDQGNLKTFPHPITTRRMLADCLTAILFTASAQHSTMNMPQEPYNSFVPNRPQTLMNLMPEGEEDITMKFIMDSLPNTALAMAQFQIAHLFTVHFNNTLTKLDNIKDMYPDIHYNFQKELRNISKEIQLRNEQLEAAGKPTYTYLDPQFIPASIDT